MSDDTGSMEVIFFNARYLKNVFKQGESYLFFGKVSRNFGKLQMVHPEFERASEAGSGILAVYPLTKGISQREMRNWQEAVRPLYEKAEDFLSDEMKSANRLCSLRYALKNVHFPEEKQSLLEAKYRLIFDELLVLQTGMMAARAAAKEGKDGIAFSRDADISEYIDSLPYSLTEAQSRCVREIEEDLESEKAMNRLVQGDVGSGKTAVAEIALYKAVKSGWQAVLMAPTEILARQHFDGIGSAFRAHGIRVGFLSSSVGSCRKEGDSGEDKDRASPGGHRHSRGDTAGGGVCGAGAGHNRRAAQVWGQTAGKAQGKGQESQRAGDGAATPIPRTLSVVLYGDMDVSVIDQLPPGRQPVRTRSIGQEKRDLCYDFVKKQLEMGRQAYVVTPLIEGSESVDARSALQVSEELRKRFSRISCVAHTWSNETGGKG